MSSCLSPCGTCLSANRSISIQQYANNSMEVFMVLKKVFEPITINQTKIRNRMVVSAMVTNFCGADGKSNQKFIAYHEHKARGGFGLIITEDFAISPTAGGFKTLPGLWCDEQIPSHRELTDRVHAQGAKIICQIYHAGRETSSDITGVHNIAPSPIKEPTVAETPREMTIAEIHQMVEDFGSAARRARAAGFDGVEIHAAHGYMIEQFLSPFSNRRCDEYGGTIQNRCRFMVEVIKEIRKQCGADFIIQMRLSAVEYVPGGLEIEESKVIAQIAEDAGLNSINISQGVYASVHIINPPSCIGHGAYINNAYEIKKAVSIPVIGVGRINDPAIAEAIISSGKTDMCIMARASLADPDMPRKAAAGEYDDIIHCVGCLQGCIGENSKGNKIRCLVNPMTGMEDEYHIEPASAPGHIVVVGGGVAGCEAAIVAAQRGHKVTMLEQSDEIGGQFISASIPIGKGEFNSFIVWQKHMLKKLGVDVVYGAKADRELIDGYKPDAVIIASGSIPAMPPIPGLAQYSHTAHEFLRGRRDFGSKVVVIGGGLVGAETADHMAVHGASDVTVLEMQPEIMTDGEYIPTLYLKKRFKDYGVHVETSAVVKQIEEHAVVYVKDSETFLIDGVDTIVNATGVMPDCTVADALRNAPYKVVVAGDANSAKNGYKNIREGFEAGLYI